MLASERPVIQTVFNVPMESIREMQPGQAVMFTKNGKMRTVQINKARELKACSFERIYFSRGSDADIYKERKLLGKILKAITARDIWDMTQYFEIMNDGDATIQKALEVISQS